MKTKIKRFIHGSILIGTLIACARYMIVSEHGLLTYWKLKEEIVQKELVIYKLETEVNQLNVSIEKLESDPFEKERIARQDLQLGYRNEVVYIVNDTFINE